MRALPAVFLDRDGVIIKNRFDYVKSWRDVCFLPNALEALERLNRTKFKVILVTNQSVVGRGIITPRQAMEINQLVIAKIELQGGRVDASYLCPHHPDNGCDCRKPAPGMLLRAARELNLDLSHSYLIGDAISDIQAAQNVGVQGILVLTGITTAPLSLLESYDLQDCLVVTGLEAAVDYILGQREEHL